MIRPMGSVIKSLSKERYKTAKSLCRNGFGVSKTHSHSVIWGSFQMLLEEGDYSRQEKEDKIQHGNLSRIYWLIVTAGYLAWSFISGKWDRTWIIWPIAAVAYGAVFGITKALRKKNG